MPGTARLTAGALAGLLADPRRMRVLAAVALGAREPGDIPSAAGLPAKDSAAALRRLQAHGLVVSGADGLGVDHDGLRVLSAELAGDSRVDDGDTPGDLLAFVRGRRLLSLPAQSSRRARVLAHVADHTFVAGIDYEEPTVNALLGAWCEEGEVDHAALRRYLVEEGLLSRGAGTYRFGATVEPGPGERAVRAYGLT